MTNFIDNENPLSFQDLTDNPDLMNRETLTNSGCGSLFQAFNNCYLWFEGGMYNSMGDLYEDILENKELDEEQRNTFQQYLDSNKRTLSDIQTVFENILKTTDFSTAEIQLIANFTFMNTKVIGYPLVNSLVINDEDTEIIRGIDLYIEVYKGMRSLGYDHWEGLCK